MRRGRIEKVIDAAKAKGSMLGRTLPGRGAISTICYRSRAMKRSQLLFHRPECGAAITVRGAEVRWHDRRSGSGSPSAHVDGVDSV